MGKAEIGKVEMGTTEMGKTELKRAREKKLTLRKGSNSKVKVGGSKEKSLERSQ